MTEWPQKDHDQFDISRLAWLISGHDFRIHAFYDANPAGRFMEALCQHSVQPKRVVDPTETALTPQRCMACQLILGEILGSLLGDGTDWNRDE